MKKATLFIMIFVVTGNHVSSELPDRFRASPYFEVIREGDLTKVEKLIAQGYDVNYYIDPMTNPLGMACSDINLPIMQALLQAGANPNPYKGPNYSFPLFVYVLDGVRHSLEKRASHIADEDVMRAFKFLIKYGADVNMPLQSCGKFINEKSTWYCSYGEQPENLIDLIEKTEKSPLKKELIDLLRAAGAR